MTLVCSDPPIELFHGSALSVAQGGGLKWKRVGFDEPTNGSFLTDGCAAITCRIDNAKVCTGGLFGVLGLGCSYVTVANLLRNDTESRTKQGGFRVLTGENDLMLRKLKGIFQVFSRTRVFLSGKLWFRQSLHMFKANLSKLRNTSAQISVAK